MNPRVSVIIPTYNYGHYLSEAINSVLSQTLPIDEIIVVDDGSTDNTEEIVGTFGDKVIYVRKGNAGLSAARNTGIERSTGDLVAFLDADDIWYPEKTEKQVALFEVDESIGMVYSCVREFESDTGETVTTWCEGKEGWMADDLLRFEGAAVSAIGSTGLVKREVFETIGNFDTNLKHSEDWDFSYRLARKYKLGLVREVLVDYRNHGQNMHMNVSLMERSMNYCFDKAFATDDDAVLRFRRRSYGNLYSVLAASYFHSGKLLDFVRCSIKSVWFSPGSLARRLFRRSKPIS